MGNKYSIRQIIDILKPLHTGVSDVHAIIETLAYDSRKVKEGSSALFFALQGLRDGHTFLQDAYAVGVRNFVVSDTRVEYALAGANVIVVAEPLQAMQSLAAWHRNQFDYPVMAITGSNGKTMVKDWLYELLSPEYRIVRSPKSYNSQLGVSLSLWQMHEGYDLAIIEAGISREGEMAVLAEIIRPDIAVLTNVGAAHQEGFRSWEQKKEEKMRLLAQADKAVLPHAWGHPDAPLSIRQIETGFSPGWSRVEAVVRRPCAVISPAP